MTFKHAMMKTLVFYKETRLSRSEITKSSAELSNLEEIEEENESLNKNKFFLTSRATSAEDFLNPYLLIHNL